MGENTDTAAPGPGGILLAAPKSGSGKTLLTCALLRSLTRLGIRVQAFKCGPDYIDPMFHQRVLGIPSANLDTWFTGKEGTRRLYRRHMQESGAGIGVIEGVMGLYDGVGGITGEASSYDLACTLQVPVLLIIDAAGMGRSLIALIRGFQLMDTEHRIAGVLLNRTSAAFCRQISPEIEKACGIPVVGCFPTQKDLHLDSRYLGLKLPDEIAQLKEAADRAADVLEQNADIDRILRLSEENAIHGSAACEEDDESCCCAVNVTKRAAQEKPAVVPSLAAAAPAPETAVRRTSAVVPPLAADDSATGAAGQRDLASSRSGTRRPFRVAIARDEAFCFYYEDNVRLLKDLGAEQVPFSPIHDAALPEDVDGLILGGGYPELRAAELSANVSMKKSIAAALRNGMPSIAECGGFMYLHEELQTQDGEVYPMVGAVRGRTTWAGHLVRFGYCAIREKQPCFLPEGKEIRGHEFHYYDSTDNGRDCMAQKPVTGRSWECVHETDHSFWGYPHLYWPSAPEFACHFARLCREYWYIRN